MMIDLVFKQLGRHKARTALTVLGVAIGILLVTTLSSFSEGITSRVNTELTYLSGVITVTASNIGFESFSMSELDGSVADEIASISGIERVAPIMAGSIPGLGEIYGADLDSLDVINIDVSATEGRYFEDGSDELILGSDYAKSSGLRVGDEVTVRGKRHEIVGVLEPTGASEDKGLIGDFNEVQEMLGMGDKVTLIFAKPFDAGETESIARDIENRFDNVQALTEKDAVRKAGEFTTQLSVMTFGMGSIAAIIAGLGIMNVMFMSVRERRREIGTMKALGATTYQILGQIILEAVLLTVIGEVIGLLLSMMAVNALNSLTDQVSATITPWLVITVSLFAVGLGVFSGILPAREAARLDPAVVLRYE